jgi:hypothetical protein
MGRGKEMELGPGQKATKNALSRATIFFFIKARLHGFTT